MKVALWIVLACCLSLPAWGQSDSAIQAKIASTDHGVLPDGFEIVTVPEATWHEMTNRWEARTDTAFTDLRNQTIYLREFYVLRSTPEQLHHTLAHEAGHVSCLCKSETIANNYASHHP